MMKYNFSFTYELDGKLTTINKSDEIVDLSFSAEKYGVGTRVKMVVNPKKKITLRKAIISKKQFFDDSDCIFVNGYQSWTDTKEFLVSEKIHDLKRVPKFLMKKYAFDKYGDSWFRKSNCKSGVFYGYTYAYIRRGNYYSLLGSINDFNSYTIFTFDTRQGRSFAEADIDGVVCDSQRTLFDYISANGDEAEVFNLYKKAFNLPSCRGDTLVGFTSWYKYYQDIDEKKLFKELESSNKINFNLFQIDDGYEKNVGDWIDVDYEKFPSGLKFTTEKIHEKDMLAGIWLAPFVCEVNSKITREHPDWIVKDKNGNKIFLGSNWSGFYALDIFNPQVQEHIKKSIQFMVEENNFDLLKLDFLYAACFSTKEGMTRAEVMKYGMDLIKKYSKDALLLGCGVPLASVAGVVDYCRIGPDISLKFDDVWYMKKFHRERISTKVTLVNTIARRHLDNFFFLNDPDVFLMREEENDLSKKQRSAIGIINFLFGSICLTSDTFDNYNSKTKTFYHILYDSIRNHKPHGVMRIRNKIYFYIYRNSKRVDCIYDMEKGILDYEQM